MYQTSQDNCCLAAKSHLTLCDLMDCSPQDDFVGFPRQEYGNGLPFPCPGDLPDPGIEPESPALQVDSLSLMPPGKPLTRQVPFSVKTELNHLHVSHNKYALCVYWFMFKGSVIIICFISYLRLALYCWVIGLLLIFPGYGTTGYDA